jgi:isoleucyl-tRNA synthetase
VTCPRCGGSELVAESDIVDVWFESGVSHTAVLDERPELHRPADLYLEGSDQHRGWFQSALLTSVGAFDAAPFDTVLTHGFIVDGEGRKMSKSLGNVISPLDVVRKYGADVIRLWVASADYSQDISVSDEILDRTSEAYRRIRNTFRFLLANLADYDPSRAVSRGDMPEIDRYALVALSDLEERVTRAYEDWKYHMVYRHIYDYCVTDLSAFYLDVLKDRLYADAADSVGRRSAQTVLAEVLTVLVRLVAPVLTFTAEEVWQFMPESLRGGCVSVQLAGWPAVVEPEDADALRERWDLVLQVREKTNAVLEAARGNGEIGKSQEARVTISADGDRHAKLARIGADALAESLIVSEVVLETKGAAANADVTLEPAIEVTWAPATGGKCPRCWNWRNLGSDGLCERCSTVVGAL